jgi:hypothetical protein
MQEFNIPMPELPQMPYIPERVLHEFRVSTSPSAMQVAALEVDYEKLGSTIAKQIPPQTSVSVNMDEVGFKKYLQRDSNKHKINNTKHNMKV